MSGCGGRNSWKNTSETAASLPPFILLKGPLDVSNVKRQAAALPFGFCAAFSFHTVLHPLFYSYQ